jgi:hypothetical protein
MPCSISLATLRIHLADAFAPCPQAEDLVVSKTIAPVLALALFLGGSAMLQSCSDQQSTTTSSTVAPGSASTDPSAQQAPTSTTTTTTTSEEPDSILGSTLHAVGTVVLFPFRLIGDAIELIV